MHDGQQRYEAMQRFEAWAKDNLGQGYSLEREEDSYPDPVTRWAFIAWQAAERAERPAPNEKLLRRMPSEAMVEAGRAAMSPEKFVSHCRTLMVWQAMWDAAPAVANPDDDYVKAGPVTLTKEQEALAKRSWRLAHEWLWQEIMARKEPK